MSGIYDIAGIKTGAKFASFFNVLMEWISSHSSLFLILLTLVALVIIQFSLPGDSMLVKIGADDPWSIAQNIYQGKGYTACERDYFPFCETLQQPTAMREPVPVLMFLAVMMIYPHPLSGVLLEAILYIAVALILYFSLREQGRVFALLAAALWITSLPVIQQIGNGNGEMENALWVSLAFWCFQKGRVSHRTRDWILAGLFFGLAALTRTVMLGVALGVLVGLLFERGVGSFSLRARLAFIALTTIVLTLLPWTIRNQIVFGKPIFTNTMAGYNIYRHNYFVGDPNFYPHYVGSSEADKAIKNLVQRSNLSGTENELVLDSLYKHEGLALIRSHPLQYASLVFFRFFALWFNASVKASYGQHHDLLDTILAAQQLLFLVAAAIGTYWQPKKFWPYALAIVLATGAYILINSQVRYLVDVMPLIATLAASVILIRKTDGNAAKRIKLQEQKL